MSFDEEKGSPNVRSLNTVEVYSIAEDKWTQLEPFKHARQSFSVCHFNEKFIAVFGGKCIMDDIAGGYNDEPFEFVNQVEVYEIEKNAWKVINYITDNHKLRVLHPGTAQISSSKIMIFGGIVPT